MRMSMEQVLYIFPLFCHSTSRQSLLLVFFVFFLHWDMMEVFKTVWCVQYHQLCEAGPRQTNEPLHIFVLPCQCRHPWLSCMCFFLPVTSHKPTFLHEHNTCTPHSGQDLHIATHAMYMGVLDPPSCLACSFTPCHKHNSGSPPATIIICLVVALFDTISLVATASA